MNNSKLVHPNRKINWSRLAFPLGVSILFVAALLWGFGGAATAHADFPASPAIPQNGTVTVPSGDPIEIALVMDEGWASIQYITETVEMAIDDYGAIKGSSLQRNDYDGGCDPTSGENAANAVVANAQNVGVIGLDCSSSAAGALPVLETAGVVLISHSSTSGNLPSLGPTVFNRVIVSDTSIVEWDAKISRLPLVRSWEMDFESIYGHAPGGFTKYVYDAATLLLTRIDSVSTVDDGGNLIIDRAALAAAVRGTAGFPGLTDDITLEADGDRVNRLTGTGPRYVAPSGSDGGGNDCVDSTAPCASVGRGTALADDRGDVLIAAGTYTENVTIEGITLTLRGGYTISGTEWLTDTGETVIDGNDAGRVFFIHGNNSTLENLTVTGGNAPDEQCWGGGVWITNGNYAIRNIVFRNNKCSGLEINVDFGPVDASIEDSMFMENSKFDHGGAINTWGGSVNLTNVLLVSNTKNSLVSSGDSQVTILNSTFTDNAADGPAITIIGSGVVSLTNSIVWGNPGGNLACEDGTCNIMYSDIEGGGTDAGNIDEDPMFVDPVNGDYRLKFGSPCIDAGTDSGAPDHDIVGTERPLDGDGDGTKTTDIGAFEFMLSQFQLYLPLIMLGG